jgi:tRNA 2-thiouridine synthesizing protein B
MLHIVNKSSLASPALESALRLAQSGAAVLLIEDAVYAATRGNAASARIEEAAAERPVYALMPDLEARGVADRIVAGVKTVDYGGFVDLVAEHRTCQSWL